MKLNKANNIELKQSDVVKFKKLSVGVTIAVVLLASGIGYFYLSEFTSPTQPVQPTKIHNFQVKVNDTFAIGEKHG